MKKKGLLTIFILVAVMTFGIMSAFVTACSEKEEEFPIWDISSNGNQITASFSDNGKYGFILTIEGSGTMKDYASAKDTPWYGRSGRVTEIIIQDGITYVGSNSFPECVAVKTVTLPQSVTAIGDNVFSDKTQVVWWDDGNLPNEEPATKKILFIGNSYTYYNAMPILFKKIANGVGVEVDVTAITEGSRRFSEWSDPNNVYGARVEAALTATNDYDIIVLQDRSVSPLSEYNTSLSGAKALANRIRETQNNCKIFLYQTWGNPSSQGNYGGSIPEMESRLRTAYESMASEIGATVSYVGKAFTYIYETCDLANLGKTSDMWLYQDDDTHPTYMGSYLSACVHAATILGIDPGTSTYNGEVDEELVEGFKSMWDKDYAAKYTVGLDGTTATLMKEVAYSIVYGTTS